MSRTAKVFMTGNSQAIRLPVDLRYPPGVTEVTIRVDPINGDLILSREPQTWAVLFSYLDGLSSRQAFGQLALQLEDAQ